MRDGTLWAAAIAFLLTSLFTVAVRRDVYDLARRIGELEAELQEQRRRNDNLDVRRERLRSPGALLLRAEEAGLMEDEER